jgi:hypothetical protein
MLTALSLDPGDHTGWLFRDAGGILSGGTILFDVQEIHRVISRLKPQVIVFENFTLHPGAAKSLTHNEMYPCQIIGVIKLSALLTQPRYFVKLAPSVKRFSSLDARWNQMKELNLEIPTEHTKDAYLLLKYFEMFYENDPHKLKQCLLPEKM